MPLFDKVNLDRKKSHPDLEGVHIVYDNSIYTVPKHILLTHIAQCDWSAAS